MHPHKKLWLPCSLRPPGVLRVTPVYPLQHVAELCGRQAHRTFLDRRPDEASPIEPLGVERQAQPIMPEDLDQGSALAAEDEEIAGVGITLQPFLDLEREPLHAAAHVCMAGREP